MAQKQSRFMSFSPEIIKMRKEYEKKFGNTAIFDYFYTGLCQRVGKSWSRSMKEWAKSDGKIISRNKTISSGIGAVADVYVFDENVSLFKEDDGGRA